MVFNFVAEDVLLVEVYTAHLACLFARTFHGDTVSIADSLPGLATATAAICTLTTVGAFWTFHARRGSFAAKPIAVVGVYMPLLCLFCSDFVLWASNKAWGTQVWLDAAVGGVRV